MQIQGSLKEIKRKLSGPGLSGFPKPFQRFWLLTYE